MLPLLEDRTDDNGERAVYNDEYSHFEVLKYFVRNSAPSLTLAFKGSKLLSGQNRNHLLRWCEYFLDVPSVQEFITSLSVASDNLNC